LPAFLLVFLAYVLGGRAAAPLATAIAADVAKMRRQFDACVEKSGVHLQLEQERIKNEFGATKQAFNQEWRQATRDIRRFRTIHPAEISDKAARLVRKIE